MADRIFRFDKQQGVEMGWHGKTDIRPDLSLDNNWLTEWDVVPVQMEKRGKPSKWTVLECSDLGDELEVGAPYNPETFQPVSNKDFLQMVKESIGGTSHKVFSAGSVRNRGRVFISIELCGMEKFKAAGREFGAYLNFGNGHDKSSVLWCNTSNICTVCDNTFTFNLFAVENKQSVSPQAEKEDDNIAIRQRHTKNVKLRLPEISRLVDKAVGVQAEFQLELDKLHQVEAPIKVVKPLFAGFIGRNVANVEKGLSTRALNTVNRLTDLYVGGAGNSGRTLADAFQAATDYYTHESSGGENVMRQYLSSEYGAGNVAKVEFWNVVRDNTRRLEVAARGEELLVNTKD